MARKMKQWLLADVDDGVLSEHKTKREATATLDLMYDNDTRSHKMTSGLYRYDAWVGEVWIETGRYIVRESSLKLWNYHMWLCWRTNTDYLAH